MSRIIHFGVTHQDPGRRLTNDDRRALTARILDDVRDTSSGHPLTRGFTLRGSFTAWNEAYPAAHRRGRGDALHVTHTTECRTVDEDGDPIRLSAQEVEEITDLLERLLPAGLRLVDYSVEDDADEWGADTRIHGAFALASIAGRPL